MTKITCAENRCQYYKNGRCQAKEINLTANSIMTLWEGRKDFNTCKTFKESEESKTMRKQIDEFFKTQEMTFEDCVMQIKQLKIKKKRLQSCINEIIKTEKDLILQIADPEIYKKIKGEK